MDVMIYFLYLCDFIEKILVRKIYGDKKERKKARKWKLRTLEKDTEGENPDQIARFV